MVLALVAVSTLVVAFAQLQDKTALSLQRFFDERRDIERLTREHRDGMLSMIDPVYVAPRVIDGVEMVDAFIEAGGKYFDTAYVYEGSEAATKVALCDRYPRESYYLADKLNASDFACKSEEEAKNEIFVSLERSGAGYFDFYLLHGIKHMASGSIWEN